MLLRLRTAVLLHTYALLLLFTPPPAAAFTCSPQNDAVTCSALADFYTSLNGAGWKSNLGWSLAAAGACVRHAGKAGRCNGVFVFF